MTEPAPFAPVNMPVGVLTAALQELTPRERRDPDPDLAIEGTIGWDGREIELSGARGGQTHLWGVKHASRWCWLHASDLEGLDGTRRAGDWIEAVSVVTPRAGREVGPSTPVTGVLLGEPFDATGPVRVLRASSEIALTSYQFETHNRSRRLRVEVESPTIGRCRSCGRSCAPWFPLCDRCAGIASRA